MVQESTNGDKTDLINLYTLDELLVTLNIV